MRSVSSPDLPPPLGGPPLVRAGVATSPASASAFIVSFDVFHLTPFSGAPRAWSWRDAPPRLGSCVSSETGSVQWKVQGGSQGGRLEGVIYTSFPPHLQSESCNAVSQPALHDTVKRRVLPLNGQSCSVPMGRSSSRLCFRNVGVSILASRGWADSALADLAVSVRPSRRVAR
jgi:hypothetical protein